MKLDNVIAALPRATPEEKSIVQVLSSVNQMIHKQMLDESIVKDLAAEVTAAIQSSFQDVGKSLLGGKALDDAVASLEPQIDAAITKRVTDSLDGIEAALLAEIHAIKIPEAHAPQDVDFGPVINAISAIRIPTPVVQAGTEPAPHKDHWTFEFKRNKRTGLLEEVIAR